MAFRSSSGSESLSSKEKRIRNWRVHGNADGSYLFFNPRFERVSLHDGVDVSQLELYNEYVLSVSGSPEAIVTDQEQGELPL